MNTEQNYQKINIKKILLATAILTIIGLCFSIASTLFFSLAPKYYKNFSYPSGGVGLATFILLIISIAKLKNVDEVKKERKIILAFFILNIFSSFSIAFLMVFLELIPKIQGNFFQLAGMGLISAAIRIAASVILVLFNIVIIIFLFIAWKKIDENTSIMNEINNTHDMNPKNTNSFSNNMPPKGESKFNVSYDESKNDKDISNKD